MKNPKSDFSPSEADRLFFHGLYEEYKNFMFYTANKYASSPHDCEDIIQDALIRLWKNIPVLQELTHFQIAKYIELTVRSAFLDHHANDPHSQNISLEEHWETLSSYEAPESVRVFYSLQIQQLKAGLSAKDWAVLEGKYILGYSLEELCAKLNLSSVNIRMTLYRARQKAQKILKNSTMDGGEDNV